MESLNIGIIGGCMICQAGLKLSQLFYRSLVQKLSDNKGIKCDINLKYYTLYSSVLESAKQLERNVKPDILILQIRPAPFIMQSEFMIQNYKGRFIINPLILSKKNTTKIEDILTTKDPLILHTDRLDGLFKKLLLLPVLRFNICLGNLFLLKRRAAKSLENAVGDLTIFCRENNIKLVIIGTINSYNKFHNNILAEINLKMKKLAVVNGIKYVDIFSLIDNEKDNYFASDKYHLNKEGHELIASLIYKDLLI
jgi:hypothetical protein